MIKLPRSAPLRRHQSLCVVKGVQLQQHQSLCVVKGVQLQRHQSLCVVKDVQLKVSKVYSYNNINHCVM